jgi:hypothetical protein
MKFLSAIITQASGSLGGATGASNRGGNYLRSRVAPVQPRTTPQQNVRALLSSTSAGWRALTASNIAGWNSLAASITLKDSLGNSYKPSGAQLYNALNINLVNIGSAVITTPPAGAPDFPDLLGITVTATAGTPTLAVVPGIGSAPTGFKFFVRASRQVSAGISYGGQSLYRDVESFAATAFASLNIEAAWVAKFGPLIAGQKIFVSVSLVHIASGFKSVPSTNTVIVGA